VEVAVEAVAAGRVAEPVASVVVERPKRVEGGRVGVEREDGAAEPVRVAAGESVGDAAAGTAEADDVRAHVSPLGERGLILFGPPPSGRCPL
jgi:hypothetical protein